MNDMVIKHLNEAIKNDSLILFVGAGVSANSGLPQWSELIKVFIDELDTPPSETDYLKIAQYYFEAVGQQKYIEKILDVFAPFKNTQPNAIHDEILRIKPKHIITTNYDSLLEQQMESNISKYQIIRKDDDIPYSKSDRYLIKMHGDLELKNIILKENDYLDYEDNFYMISTLIKALIMNNTILFIGYSLNDSTFNSIFHLIQKGFNGNARTAYFYTAQKQDSSAVEYYKNKGIRVITSGKEINNKEIGDYTVKFLKQLSSDEMLVPSNADEIWENIKYLDQLAFVENSTVATAVNLKKRATLFPLDQFKWVDKGKDSIQVLQHSELSKFLEEKTTFNQFLDFERNDNLTFDFEIKSNPVLKEAYELYIDKKYEDAKHKFREIANKAFEKKDYWNYLISEFNILHIGSLFGNNSALPGSSAGSEDLNKIVNSLISVSDDQTKRLCIYFKDEIMSFRFIYKKIAIVNELLDKIRDERSNYQSGGTAFNSYLRDVKFEFTSLIKFINANCITVFQYNEFKHIVNQYFECLLIAFDNSRYSPIEENKLLKTTSIIEELSLTDIEEISPHLDSKHLATICDIYDISKIKISDEALEFVISEIVKYSEKEKINFFEYSSIVAKFIDILSFVEIKDINKIIHVLDTFKIFPSNKVKLQKILILLINDGKAISAENYQLIIDIINRQLNQIISDKTLFNLNQNEFNLYKLLLEQVTGNDKKVIFLEILCEKLSVIYLKPSKLQDIVNYQSVIANLYPYLSDDLQKLITDILEKYEKLSQIKVSFVESMIINNVFQFSSKKNEILTHEAQIINENRSEFYTFPDPKNNAIGQIFNLVQCGYFSMEEVMGKLNLDLLKGIPEIDWLLLNDHSDETISRLVQHRSFDEVKKYFGNTGDEKEILNTWLISQATAGNIKFK